MRRLSRFPPLQTEGEGVVLLLVSKGWIVKSVAIYTRVEFLLEILRKQGFSSDLESDLGFLDSILMKEGLNALTIGRRWIMKRKTVSRFENKIINEFRHRVV
jgi:hypothetical protein